MKSKVLIICLLAICLTQPTYAQFLKKLGKAVERELFSTGSRNDNSRDASAVKIISPDSEIKVVLKDCEQSGDFVKITLLITNQSQLDFNMQLEADDGESMAFDTEGNVYKQGITFKFGGQQGDKAQSFLPKETPVKCIVSIPVEEPTYLFKKVVVFCRGINASLESNLLQLSNIPVMQAE